MTKEFNCESKNYYSFVSKNYFVSQVVWRYAREQNIHIDDQVTYSLSGNSSDDPFIMDQSP